MARKCRSVFCDEQYENISAIIFNCNATWGKVVALANKNNPNGQISSVWAVPPEGKPEGEICKPSEYIENILDGLMIFHNPYAKIHFLHMFLDLIE